MKSEKLIEWYGRRFTPVVAIAGFFLIMAFGILMAFSKSNKDYVEQMPQGGNSNSLSQTQTRKL